VKIPLPTTLPAPAAVDITILGRRYRVRPDVSLVWALYDEGYIAASNRFCWNATCLYCMVTVVLPNSTVAVRAKACEVYPTQGLAVIKLGGEFCLPARLAS
jgi:aerobic-type carbon monoxide dehydrogenase small subunit (CoxS/CutS family)